MYYIKNIRAENLFSWSNLNLELENNAVYSIVGENGSGKSSVFEIIKWVLFKKSNKKHITKYGNNVGNGWLTLVSDKSLELIIHRNTSSPTTITINGKEETQETLEMLLGCNYVSFMSAIMCDQKRVASFVNEKTPAGKSKIFGEMVGATILDKMRDRVQIIRQDAERIFEKNKSITDTLETEVDELESSFGSDSPKEFLEELKKIAVKVNKYNNEYDVLEKKRAEGVEINRLWQQYKESLVVITSIKGEIKDKIALIQALKIRLSSSKYSETAKRLEELREREKGLRGEVILGESQYKTLKEEVIRLEESLVDGGVCPTCGTRLVGEDKIKHIQNEAKQKNSMMKKIQSQTAKIKVQLSTLTTEISVVERKANEYNNDKNKLINLVNYVKEKKNTLKFINCEKPEKDELDLIEIVEKMNSLTDTIFRLNNEISTGKEKLNNYKRIKEKLKVAKEDLEKSEKVYNIYKWMFDNLPIMKLRYIDGNKELVESLANESLSQLGIPFMVKIETQREMARGKKIKDEFNLQIINVAANQESHHDDLSGGEEVCILLALQFAINSVFNTNVGFEVYDEVYAPLDKRNKGVVIDMLKHRSIKKQVLSVSHDDEISHSFDSVVSIEKIDGSSKIRRN